MPSGNQKGPDFLTPPDRGPLTVKSATGITRVTGSNGRFEHGDSPVTPATDRANVGVTTANPKGGPSGL